MASKLSIYNGALTILGERKLASLNENREPRHKLDEIWDNDFVDRVLQQGQWNFATRSVKLEFSPSVTPDFGYARAFDKPIDFIRTVGVYSDEYFRLPLTNYMDEAAWWFADVDELYVRYVSNDNQFGGDFSLWPPNFTEYAEHYMAHKVGPRLTGLDVNETKLEAQAERMLLKAKSTDSMESPAKFPPTGSWARSRGGFRSGQRGNRNQLIG